MDPERSRIQADLRGLLKGEVRCDDVFLQMYASDASVYEIKPLGVVRPRGLDDVVTCVRYAAENGVPIIPRGAGTGLAGESLGRGLVLDFSHSMRRILATGEDTVRVQPGVVLSQLNRHLEKMGRCFGPDPATRSVTTMGSVLALDNSGSHWLRYGSARRHTVSMQVVLSDGEVIEAATHPVFPSNPTESPRCRSIVESVAELVERNQRLLRDHQPKTAVNRSGYHLYDVLSGGQLNLARMLVGSEGTLAVITEATVRTEPLPTHRGVALLFFDRLEAAARGALEVSAMGIAACDLLDRRLLSIARDVDVRYDLLIPPQAEAMLLVELRDEDENQVRDRLEQIVTRLHRRKRLAFHARTTMEPDERNLYWRLIRRVIPMLYRLKGTTRPLPFVEDIAVPPATLPDFITRLQNVLKTHQVTASLFAHAGHGQLHIRPFLDLASPDDVRTMQELANDLYNEVLDVGGTVSGEHGDGLSRTWFLHRQHGPLYGVFRDVKKIFDPQNILNPGKVVAESPQPLTKNLRPVAAAIASGTQQTDKGNGTSGERNLIPLQLAWDHEEITHAARNCNGCGRCRTQAPDERMCPIFRLLPAEEASPRAKANLMRAVLTGSLDASTFTSDDLKDVADLCFNCHQCRLECPASVDIPRLMVECKAQYVATNGLRLQDWFMARHDLLSRLGSAFRSVANWMIGNRAMRWVMEKTFGIAQGRKLPRIAKRTFLRLARQRRMTRPVRSSGRKVVYFVDSFANWHDVQLAEALVAVMEHNGVSVYVHPRQVPSGMSLISMGAVEKAKRFAARNVEILAEAVRQGYHIVASEPSAALCLTHEYPNLLGDEETQLVAENSSEACTYLWKMHSGGNLQLDFKPLNATLGYHLPCHLKALNVGSPGENLLRLIPGLTVRRIEQGCSGMAGTFGFQKRHYRNSLRVGFGLISAIREPQVQAGTTECAACKIQMEQGTTKPTIHPIKVLALAYELMPEIESALTSKGMELVVT